MEDVRIICTPFLLAAIVFTLSMLYNEQYWKRKNPWWSQDDRQMRLSPQEQAFRQNERHKHNNAIMAYFAVLFMIIGLMIFALSAHRYGKLMNLDEYWILLIPIVGALFLAISGIKRK